jgi:hypothetical protein
VLVGGGGRHPARSDFRTRAAGLGTSRRPDVTVRRYAVNSSTGVSNIRPRLVISVLAEAVSGSINIQTRERRRDVDRRGHGQLRLPIG